MSDEIDHDATKNAVRVNLIRELCEAVGYSIAVWTRGGKGQRSLRRQARAISAVFEALAGRKPTPEELDAMGGTTVFG
jgi:hypothetical protein